MNKYICTGIMGNSPDIISKGCKLRLAITPQTGEITTWVNIYVFGISGENCIKYKKQGDKIEIEGRVENSKDGKMVIVAEQVRWL